MEKHLAQPLPQPSHPDGHHNRAVRRHIHHRLHRRMEPGDHRGGNQQPTVARTDTHGTVQLQQRHLGLFPTGGRGSRRRFNRRQGEHLLPPEAIRDTGDRRAHGRSHRQRGGAGAGEISLRPAHHHQRQRGQFSRKRETAHRHQPAARKKTQRKTKLQGGTLSARHGRRNEKHGLPGLRHLQDEQQHVRQQQRIRPRQRYPGSDGHS